MSLWHSPTLDPIPGCAMTDRVQLRVLHGDVWPPSFLPEVGRKLSEASSIVAGAARHSPVEVLDALARIVSAAVAAEVEVIEHTTRASRELEESTRAPEGSPEADR